MPPLSRHDRSDRTLPLPSLTPARLLGLGVMAAGLLSGCSVSMPMGSLLARGSDDDVTGSIRTTASLRLEGEDWRRAKAALATALDPQGNGSQVSWDNPASHAKGSFVALGKAYPDDARICRAFVTDIEQDSSSRSLQGTACADKSGEWSVTGVKAVNKS